MHIQGLNHFLFSVSNLEQSIEFYQNVFGAKLLVKGRTTAYFDLCGMWLALNEEAHVTRVPVNEAYTHIAFTIQEEDFDELHAKLVQMNVQMLPGRPRDKQDRKSMYFVDPDGHRFEFHTGTLQDRLDYYARDKQHMIFYPQESARD